MCGEEASRWSLKLKRDGGGASHFSRACACMRACVMLQIRR